LVPSFAMTRPVGVVMIPNRSPAPFLIRVLVATCLPAGVQAGQHAAMAGLPIGMDEGR